MGAPIQPFRRTKILCIVLGLLAKNGAMGFRAPATIYGRRTTPAMERSCGTKWTRDGVRLQILNTPVLDSPNPEERFGWNAREMDDESTLNSNPNAQDQPTVSNLKTEIPAGLAFSVQMKDAGLPIEHEDSVSGDLDFIGADSGETDKARATSLRLDSDISQADSSNQEYPMNATDGSIELRHVAQEGRNELASTDDGSEAVNNEENLQTLVPEQEEQALRPPAFARPEACPPSIAMPDVRVADIKKTLSTPTWKDSLTKIASAFRSDLIVEDIREVRVGTVDEFHLDVEALVCKEEDCVMVQVPVDFPSSCQGSDDTSQCILDNIEELNRMIKVEEESELFPTEKTLVERERLLKEVVSPKFLEYPSWWSTPIVLARDCENLRVVLNEADCQPQLQRLFRKNSPKNVRKLVQAAIVAVGPCGVLLRALDTKNNLHEVPIAFSVAATDAGRLRSAILELFD